MSTEGPSPSYHFEVVNSSGDTHVYEISEPLCSLGTSEDEADILIDDPSLRPVHLILSFDGFRVRCRPVGGDIRIGTTVMPALTPFLLQNELRLDFGYSSLTLKQVVSGEDEVENLKTPPRGIRVAEIAALLGDPVPAEEPAPRASPPPPPARSSTLSYRVPESAQSLPNETDAEPDEADWERLDRDPEPVNANPTPGPVLVAPEPAPAPEPVEAAHIPESSEPAPLPEPPEPALAPDPAPTPVIQLPIGSAPEPTPPPTVILAAKPEATAPAPAPAPLPAAFTPPVAITPPQAAPAPSVRRIDAPTAAGAVQVSSGDVPWDFEIVGMLFATAAATIGDDVDAAAPGSPFRVAEAELRRQAFALGCHGVAFTRFDQRVTSSGGWIPGRPFVEVVAYGTAVRRVAAAAR